MRAPAVNRLVIRVVRGQPDDEEHAAVVAALELAARRVRQSLAADPGSRARAPWGRGSRTTYRSPRSWKSL
jgi:Acyl-CoA carboxylase epsilon subunit